MPNLLQSEDTSCLLLTQELHWVLEQLQVWTWPYPSCTHLKNAIVHQEFSLPSMFSNAVQCKVIQPLKGIGSAFNYSWFSHNTPPNKCLLLFLWALGVHMYLCHALKQSTIPAQVCKNLPPKAGKSETSSTNAWIRDVPDTPGRQAPKFCKKAKWNPKIITA